VPEYERYVDTPVGDATNEAAIAPGSIVTALDCFTLTLLSEIVCALILS
jgi:hypothetical protein